MNSVKEQIDVNWRIMNDLDRKISNQFTSGIVSLISEEIEGKIRLISTNVKDDIYHKSYWRTKGVK